MTYLDDYDEILTVKDIKEILGIGLRQAYTLVKTNEFKYIRIRNTKYYSKRKLTMWLSGEKFYEKENDVA